MYDRPASPTYQTTKNINSSNISSTWRQILIPDSHPQSSSSSLLFSTCFNHEHHHQIHQSLLDGVANNVGIGSLVVVIVASANVFVDILLLVGACCRTRLDLVFKSDSYLKYLSLFRCLLLPWLILSMLELVVLGCPTGEKMDISASL